MLGDILDVVATALEPLWGTGTGARTPTHEQLLKAGRVLVFEGCVIGPRPYCRPEPAFLHLSRSALAISPVRGTDARARHLPVDELELVEVRRWRKGDPEAVKRHWDVIECRDGADTVLIGFELFYTAYVRQALQLDDTV
ncbi:hypothetical protein ABTY61_29555 [Kitasatospora sp. NPDC096128]|uniref:hypothetical protein n=1 Tax=Kitasatospora sp. NPDC096128 TaxID=3155547 RepID=UPI00332EC1A8